MSNPKYKLSTGQDRLTVNNVVGADEGRYSCSYEASDNQVNGTAGYLTVYGKHIRNYNTMYVHCMYMYMYIHMYM